MKPRVLVIAALTTVILGGCSPRNATIITDTYTVSVSKVDQGDRYEFTHIHSVHADKDRPGPHEVSDKTETISHPVIVIPFGKTEGSVMVENGKEHLLLKITKTDSGMVITAEERTLE